MGILQSSIGNALLSALTAKDYALIEPHLTRVPLPLRFELQKAGQPIRFVYFPEDGVVSVIATAPKGKLVEAGMFGREGMSATALVLGTDQSPHDMYMQIAGVSGLRIEASALQRAMAASVPLHALLLRHVQTAMVQSASSILAVAGYTIEQRLARLLVMCHDRVSGDEIRLTHECMSAMLGARRASVTIGLQSFDDQRLVGTKRGCVLIRDRDALERLAAGSYGFAEAEYMRLMGNPLRNDYLGLSSIDAESLALVAA